MSTWALLVSATTRGIGAARIPRALARAGFGVALLTPRNSLAEKSRFVAKVAHLPDNATPREWLFAFAATVKATAPRIVIPCDDMAFGLLARLVLAPPSDLRPELQMQLAALIRESLGDPSHFQASLDKTLLPLAAEALGVRVPAHSIVTDIAGIDEFAAARGYPLVLQGGRAIGGQSAVQCADRSHVTRAFAAFAPADSKDRLEGRADRCLVQACVDGKAQHYHAAAWNGDVLAGWALERIIADPVPAGPPAVSRIFRSPALRDLAQKLAKGLGISGLFSAEFIVDPRTDEPMLLGISRRVGPATHRGAARNVDTCAALYAAVNGTVSTSRSTLDEGEEGVSVHFPQEWLRDPESPYLRLYPSDVPWDDPDLIEALLAMRNGPSRVDSGNPRS